MFPTRCAKDPSRPCARAPAVIDSATSDYIELNELRTEVLALKQEASGHRTREKEQAATQEQQLLASQQGARLAWTEVQDAVATSNELQERLTATEQDIKKIGKFCYCCWWWWLLVVGCP